MLKRLAKYLAWRNPKYLPLFLRLSKPDGILYARFIKNITCSIAWEIIAR